MDAALYFKCVKVEHGLDGVYVLIDHPDDV